MSNIINVDFSKKSAMHKDDKVSLRAVYQELQVKKDFTSWAKVQLRLFKENQEFGKLTRFGEPTKGRGGHNKIDYWVTIDAAKEISMMSRTPKGQEVRNYFIECEELVVDHNLEHKLSNIPSTIQNLETFVEDFTKMRVAMEEMQKILARQHLSVVSNSDERFANAWFRMKEYDWLNLKITNHYQLAMELTQHAVKIKHNLSSKYSRNYGRINTYPKWLVDNYHAGKK